MSDFILLESSLSTSIVCLFVCFSDLVALISYYRLFAPIHIWGLTSWKLCEIFNRLCVFLASKVSTHSTKSNVVQLGVFWCLLIDCFKRQFAWNTGCQWRSHPNYHQLFTRNIAKSKRPWVFSPISVDIDSRPYFPAQMVQFIITLIRSIHLHIER